jgi:adenylate kinase family enzyme
MSKKRRGRTPKHAGSLGLALLTGIPATGKTTVGDYLRDHCGFKHINFEGAQLWHYVPSQVTVDASRIKELMMDGRDVVISWGFVRDTQLGAVCKLRELGFRWVWFEGDRQSALRRYLALGRSRSDWDRKLEKIGAHIDPILERLSANRYQDLRQRRATAPARRSCAGRTQRSSRLAHSI